MPSRRRIESRRQALGRRVGRRNPWRQYRYRKQQQCRRKSYTREHALPQESSHPRAVTHDTLTRGSTSEYTTSVSKLTIT